MAATKKQDTENRSGTPANFQKVELDRIELPPEILETPVADPPGGPEIHAKPSVEIVTPTTQSVSRDVPPAPPEVWKLPAGVRGFLIAIASIAAIIWGIIGALYLYAWLFP